MVDGSWSIHRTIVLLPSAISHQPWQVSLYDPSSADQPHEKQHDRDDQQDVDEVAQGVTADHTQQPQHDQNDSDRFQHVSPPILNPGSGRPGLQLECRVAVGLDERGLKTSWNGASAQAGFGSLNANVMVPSMTDLPSTRATPLSIPIRLRSRTTFASMTTTSPGWTARR